MAFEGRYGASAVGYIHVHHLRFLAAVGEEYKLVPVHALVPVCPNFHVVMHMRPEAPYLVDEVRDMAALLSR